MQYKIFQYVPMSKPKALLRMVPKILNLNANVVLDIEDGVQDTLNPINTSLLKKEARDSIPILIKALLKKNDNIDNNIYIRLNSAESGELAKDIDMMHEIMCKVKKIGIFVPMTRTAEDLLLIKNLIGAEFQEKTKIVPIIETVEGRRNLNEILAHSSELNIEYIHYGHYDYSLDSSQWPFQNQDEESFWIFVADMIHAIEESGNRYLHTPLGDLSNEGLYKSIIKKLTNICKQDFGVTALNFNQVLFAQCINQAKTLQYRNGETIDKRMLAEEIIHKFENNQCSKRSFSVDVKNTKFLTPHEYRMAKKYLKAINERN